MPAQSKERGNVVRIDSSIDWDRKLKYMEKQSGRAVFRSIYWGIYVFMVGFMVLLLNAGLIGVTALVGWAVTVLSIFVIVYGFVISLHLKFAKKHG
jgi:hypothetical protein